MDQERALAEIHHLSEQRRELISDASPSTLRATWHNEAGYIVLSLWRDHVCVATSHLTPKEAGRLAGFITSGLADLAGAALVEPITSERRRRLIPSVNSPLASLRFSLGTTLEKMGRRLRSNRLE